MNNKKLSERLNRIRKSISIINNEVNEIYNDNLEDKELENSEG